jgi:hypothetical protein
MFYQPDTTGGPKGRQADFVGLIVGFATQKYGSVSVAAHN